MFEALTEAKKAFAIGEVPVGAVLVLRGEIIARAHNMTESMQDPSAHAELLCIRIASKKLGNWRLTGSTLYTTLEPCSMCAGAAILGRVEKVVWGAPDLRHGAAGSFIDLLGANHPIHQVEYASGYLADECATLMKEFFQQRRKEKHGRSPSITR